MTSPAINPGRPSARRDLRRHRNPRIFHRHHHMSTLGIVVLIVAIAWALVVLLQPGPKYHLAQPPDGSVDSNEFARQLEAMTDTKLQGAEAIDVFDNSENFYNAELGPIPLLELDHIYHDDQLELLGFQLIRGRLALLASDHLPLLAEFRLRRSGARKKVE